MSAPARKRTAAGPVRAPRDSVMHALEDSVRHPRRNVVRAWSWKTAFFGALVRALVYLVSNRRSGALRAVAIEAAFSLFASGLLGALTQRLRDTRPLWLTALVIWVVMPAAMVASEGWLHHLAHTAHVRAGLTSSLIIAAIASGFTWFAMRRGILLQGIGDDSVAHDVRLLPRVIVDFVLWPLRQAGWRK